MSSWRAESSPACLGLPVNSPPCDTSCLRIASALRSICCFYKSFKRAADDEVGFSASRYPTLAAWTNDCRNTWTRHLWADTSFSWVFPGRVHLSSLCQNMQRMWRQSTHTSIIIWWFLSLLLYLPVSTPGHESGCAISCVTVTGFILNILRGGLKGTEQISKDGIKAKQKKVVSKNYSRNFCLDLVCYEKIKLHLG